MRLSKEDLMVKEDSFEIKELKSIEGEVALRYLTQSEIASIQKMESSGIGTLESQETGALKGRRRTKGQYQNITKINAGKQIEASQNAKIKAVSLAMSCDGVKYTPKDVERFQPKVINEIHQIVREMNELGEEAEEEIDEFLEDS